MECIDIRKEHKEEYIRPLLDKYVVGKKVTELEEVFCNKIGLVYFADSKFAVHISIREDKNFPAKIYRFVFVMKSKNNIITSIEEVTTGVLTL